MCRHLQTWIESNGGSDASVLGRLLQGFFEAYESIGARLQRVTLNAQPGLLVLDAEGGLINIFSVDVALGAVRTFRSVINPDKLGHLGYPVSDLGRREHDDE